jgi:hypothetical protein
VSAPVEATSEDPLCAIVASVLALHTVPSLKLRLANAADGVQLASAKKNFALNLSGVPTM